MFEPRERHSLLDLLRPPLGYRLEAAACTTYSLDFVALTAALLALVDAEPEDASGPAANVHTLQALTRLASRIRVYVNRGQILGAHKTSPVAALYDRVVREVCLPEGSFHPKVWVAHYRPRESASGAPLGGLLRIVCASRNLTTSQCWEAFASCQGWESPGRPPDKLALSIRAFLERVAKSDHDPRSPVTSLIAALGHTAFERPPTMRGNAAFHWQWSGGEPLLRHLPRTGRRALVVSPFVRRAFVRELLERFEEVTLISTQRELDERLDDHLAATIVAGKNRAFVVDPCDSDSDGTAMDLHAKLLVFEGTQGREVWIGSANASDSGWVGKNCEAMLAFSPGFSADYFCERFVFGEKDAAGGLRALRGWIRPYERHPWVPDNRDQAARALDDLCAAISRLEILASYKPVQETLHLSVVSPVGLDNLPKHWVDRYDVRVGVLSLSSSLELLKPFRDLIDTGVQFRGVGAADLTEFLVLHARCNSTHVEKAWVLKAKTDFAHLRDERDAQLMKRLLTKQALLEFIRAILFDAGLRPPPRPLESLGATGADIWQRSFFDTVTIEDVLQSCTEDPTRVEEINALLRAFEATGWIDPEFAAFWAAYTEAHQEVLRE